LSSYSGGSVSADTDLITIPIASGNSGFFDYYVSDGTNLRAGTVVSVWDSTQTQYTDYSTVDLGSSTLGISLITIKSGSDTTLKALVTSGTWTVKVGSRIIF
jgi:hypothetical protein